MITCFVLFCVISIIVGMLGTAFKIMGVLFKTLLGFFVILGGILMVIMFAAPILLMIGSVIAIFAILKMFSKVMN